MKIVCIGDSLTYGYGVPRKDTWVSRTAAYTGLELVNAGINGDTTGGMLARFRTDVVDRHPKAVMIMGGANDMMTGCPPFVPQSNLMSMVHQALAFGLYPLVGLPMPIWREGLREDWAAFASNLKEESSNEYRTWILEFGSNFGIPVVDFRTPFYELQRTGQADSYYLDGLHPTALGHELMAQTLCEALEKYGLWRKPNI